MADVKELIEKAVNTETFDLFETIKGNSYPEDDVVIYTDGASGQALKTLNTQIAGTTDAKELAKLEKRAGELLKKIEDSAITFHMRGMSGTMNELLLNETRDELGMDEDSVLNTRAMNLYTKKLIAASLIRAVDSKGAVSEKLWTADDVGMLRERILSSEYEKLDALCSKLSFASNYFEDIVNADF